MRRSFTPSAASLGVLAILGCQRVETNPIDYPAGLILGVVVEHTGDDGAAGWIGGPLFDGDDAAAAAAAVSAPAGAKAYLLGYRLADLRAACGRPLEVSEVLGVRLEAAGDCDALLPAPSWSRRFGALTEAPSIPLSSSFARACCPLETSGATLSVGLSCSTNAVHGCSDAFKRHGCAFDIDLSNCSLSDSTRPVISGAILPDRAVCLALPPAPAMCIEAATSTYAARTLSCRQPECQLDVSISPAQPALKVIRVPVLPGAADLSAAAVVPDGQLGFVAARYGYLTDLALAGGQLLVVARTSGVDDPGCFANFSTRRETLLVRFDTETLAQVGSSTAPRCLSHLVSEAGGQSLIGLGVESPFDTLPDVFRYTFYRFDRMGRVLTSTSVSLPDSALPNPRDGLKVIRMLAAHDRVYALVAGDLHTRFSPPSPQVTLVVFDPQRFAVERILYLGDDADYRDLVLVSDTEAATAKNAHDTVAWIDLAGGPPTRPEISIDQDVEPVQLLYDPISARLVVASAGTRPGIYVTPQASSADFSRTEPIERRAGPTAISFWPADPRRLLIAISFPIGREKFALALALFDPVAVAVLPGAHAAGLGSVGRLISDERHAYGILPWTAELIRVDAN